MTALSSTEKGELSNSIANYLRSSPQAVESLSELTEQFKSKLSDEPFSVRKPKAYTILSQSLLFCMNEGVGDPLSSNSGFVTALRIIDFSLHLLQNGIVEDEAPFQLIRSFISMCTMRQLEIGAKLVQKRLEDAARIAPRRFVFLVRTVLVWTKRDKMGVSPALVGKLRLILASATRAWHPSGMNKKGAFNADVDVDFETPQKEEASEIVDMALYKHFWGIMRYLRNPVAAEEPGGWAVVKMGMERVLEAFETLEVIEEVKNKNREESHGPGFMISPSILRLQMQDISFRRLVLVQYAIFLRHLEMEGEAQPLGKESASKLNTMEFCKSLFVKGGEGDSLKSKVNIHLDKESNGKFKKFLSPHMERDRKWAFWKKSSYKHLNVEPKAGVTTLFKKRTTLSSVPSDSGEPSQKRMRSEDPIKEWERQSSQWRSHTAIDDMEILKEEDRLLVPSLEVLKGQLKEDIEDEDITDDMKRKNNKKFVWRSLRMLCEDSVETMLQAIDDTAKTGEDLDRCVKVDKGVEKAGNDEVVAKSS